MKKTIQTKTGHNLMIRSIDRSEMPEGAENVDKYTTFYEVRNWNETGKVFFYLAKGHAEAPNQIVGWYAKHASFWASYGKTLELAIAGLQADGWMYA